MCGKQHFNFAKISFCSVSFTSHFRLGNSPNSPRQCEKKKKKAKQKNARKKNHVHGLVQRTHCGIVRTNFIHSSRPCAFSAVFTFFHPHTTILCGVSRGVAHYKREGLVATMNSSTLSVTHLHTQDTMDVVTSGFMRRLSPQSSPPRHYTLRQYGLLECPSLPFSLSILDTSVSHDQDRRAIRLMRANHAPPIVLQPRSPKQLEQWLNGMRKVKAPPLYHISFSCSNLGDTGVIMRGVSIEDGSMVVVKVIPRVRYPIQSLVETTCVLILELHTT